jgi:hypothetical protein
MAVAIGSLTLTVIPMYDLPQDYDASALMDPTGL